VESRARIQLFSDSGGTERAKPSPSTVAGAGTLSYPIPQTSQPIVHIDVVPSWDPISKGEDVSDIIAVHQDGEIRALSGDLRAEKWCTSITSLIAADDVALTSTTTFQVEYSTLIDAVTAGKGLLKERADLRAMLGTDIRTGPIEGHATVLFLVTSSREHDSPKAKPLTLRMFALQGNRSHRYNGGFMSTSPSLQHMQSITLPEPSDPESISQQSSQILLHAPRGTLYHGLDKDLRIYDLSGTVPKLSSYVRLGQNSVSSFLRLSSSSIVTASSTSLAIHDTNYRSVQAYQPLSNTNASNMASATAGAKPHLIRLLSYFSQLGIVLAMGDKNDLLAFQVTLPHTAFGGQRKRKRDGLLIDSIGRGLGEPVAESSSRDAVPMSFGSPLPSRTAHDTDWQELMTRLDGDATQVRIDKFEAVMLVELGVTGNRRWAAGKSQDLSEPGSRQNKKNAKAPQDTPLSGQETNNDQIASDVAHRNKVLYVLKKIFSFADSVRQPERTTTSSGDAASSLKVVFFPPKLFIWLAKSGNLSPSNVELALRHENHPIITPTLPAGALTEALVELDPSLVVVMYLLKSPAYLDAEELAHVVKSMLHILEAKDRTDGRFLTNGEEENITGEREDTQQCGAVTAGDDVPPKHQDLSSVPRQALMAALRRLYSFPASTITNALRKPLNGSETMKLIEELRIELSRGGWTSDPEFSSDLYKHQEHHETLHMLITLINCAVDSIGMGGWFLGASSAFDNSEDRADMLELMIAEISAVLQGVQEAAYLAGTLTQMLLYGKSAAAGTRANPPKGKDTTVIAKPVTLSLDTVDTRLLPLSLKAPQAIPLTKVGAGGEIQKRSRRDIGRLKSKMVGKYSRERILL